MLLGDCDDVEQPVSAALVGKELCAVREECRAIHAMPIPVLRAGELAELSFGECCCVRKGTVLALQNRSIMPNPAPTSKVVLIGSQSCISKTPWFPCPLCASELPYPHSPEGE